MGKYQSKDFSTGLVKQGYHLAQKQRPKSSAGVSVTVCTHPDSTPSTRLSMKKEPMMMRGMKYSQFHVFPEASLA